MSQLKIGGNHQPMTVDTARVRQTPKPAVSFKGVLQTGARVLLSGARVASGIVGGPLLSAAVTGAASEGLGQSVDGADGSLDPARALHQQRMADDLKLLALQDSIQRNNRQISLVSNVMKARHETAKSTISNIRS